jgi:hypothetical protein
MQTLSHNVRYKNSKPMFDNIIHNKAKIFTVLGLLIAVILTFYLGYSVGSKDAFQAKFIPEVETILDNGSSENSLTQIQIRDVFGSSNSKDKQPFGKFYYIIKSKAGASVTDILLKIDQAPLKITSADEKIVKDIPLDMTVDIAFKTPEGLEFEYQNIGKIRFVVDDKKFLKADFSSEVNFALDDKTTKTVQRIVLRPVDPALVNIFQDTDPSLPIKVRGDKSRGISGETAPYFWIDI